MWGKSAGVGFMLEEIVLRILGKEWIKNNGDDRKSADICRADKSEYGDVKAAFTPYPSEPTPSKLKKKDHITLDHKSIVDYFEKFGDKLSIYVAVANYPDRKTSLLKINSKDCFDIMNENPERTYTRSMRSFKDKVKKVGIKFEEFEDITKSVPKKLMKEIENIATKE